jgi:Zn-dependent protease with chaperone function
VNYSRTNPVRETIVLVGGLIGAAAVFIIGIALVVDLIVPLIPISWEARVFPGFATLFKPEPMDGSKERRERLQALLDRMSSHWSENPYQLRIDIMEESQDNAFAFPGGLVLITSGMLDDVESENELAFVIGHELGHFRNRDHLRHLGRGVALGLLVAVIRGTGGGESATSLIALAGELTTRSFSRAQEEAADAFGLELVHEEYDTVAGAWDFFGRLPQPSPTLGRSGATYLSTHPLSKERIEALEQLASDRGWPTEGELSPLRNEH